ncbi:rod shape-determining protein MreC [Oxobacter pfennigii]|uniref:rod shape-determining protein MreC n=1 Tax=Oxobacter pfennigii TaxID=36849 RepID=UPI001364D75E|nr:rod shape-determining protein MreC [Oxobacter pfennigii]
MQNKLLVVVIMLSVVFIVFIGMTASRRDRVSIFEGVVGNVLNPVQKYLYKGGQSISNMFSFITNISNIKEENDRLEAENLELENKVVDYETVKAENERLRGMLDFKSNFAQYTYLGANVTGKGTGNWYDVFIIDKGANQGVKKYYPVVTSQGLVGQVMEVGPNWSKVLSIIDEKSRVSGALSRTQDQGMIQGIAGFNGEKNCRMMYLPADSTVAVGDYVVTSGISKYFPKNIKIGEVIEVADDATQFVKSAVVRPYVDFTKLEEVFVITNAISEDDYPVEEEN